MLVYSDAYNMTYSEANAAVVAPASSIPDSAWEALPVVTIPHGTILHSNFQTLAKAHIDKVVSGAEAYREGYPIRLYRTDSGELHIVDGHHRAAICAELHTNMAACIADSQLVRKFN